MTGAAKPRYQQLKELIIERISTGELQPSDRVPSEHELVDSTGVSRMTANRALRELNDEGYVERVAGKGTFVADLKASYHVLEVRNIADEVQLSGHRYSAKVLKLVSLAASGDIATLLHTDAAIDHALVVHFDNEVPVQVEERYVVHDFAPEFLQQDFTKVTPSAYLHDITPLQEAEHVVRAAMPAADVSEYLHMENDEPCLVVTRRTWAHGRPVTFTRLYHPGGRFELTGHFSPPGTQKSVPHSADIVELRNID